jgi:hypothetical protein
MFEDIRRAKSEFATIISKIDHETSTMMEKKKVVSSEISSGTDKIITLQEKERIERKRSWNRGRRAIKRTDFYSCPMMYVAKKLLVDFNETMNSEKGYGKRLCVMR